MEGFFVFGLCFLRWGIGRGGGYFSSELVVYSRVVRMSGIGSFGDANDDAL